MGTNYYAKINCCEHCGRPEEEIHIGKSSFGWKFLVDMNDGEYYKTYEEFVDFIKQDKIKLRNEYNESVDVVDFMKLIIAKNDGRDHCKEYPEDKFADCEVVCLMKGGFS